MTGDLSDLSDLYDEPRPAGSRWTRVNIAEAIPGVPTPLSWSIWRPAMESAFWRSQYELGLAARPVGPRVTGLALGRPCISVDVAARQIAQLPGYDADAFAEQFFGLPRPDVPTPRASTPWLRLVRRAPRSVMTLRGRLRVLAAEADEAWRAGAGGSDGGDGAVAVVLEHAAGRFSAVMAAHTLQGQICQGLVEQVTKLAGADLAPRLLTGHGLLPELEVAADLWAVSRDRLNLGEFLARHGYHGPEEGELSSPSWREDPSPLEAAVKTYRGQPDALDPSLASERQRADRMAATVELGERLGRARAAQARALVNMAGRALRDRELGKATFLRWIDVCRTAARRLGEDAMWCTLDEVLSASRPSSAVVADRRGRRAELQRLELPTSWVGDPRPLAVIRASAAEPSAGEPSAGEPSAGEPSAGEPSAGEPSAGDDGAIVVGLPVSPGVARGRARVILDPGRAEPVGPDEILVAHTTDPSWVVLFLSAAALVVDVGGELSHAAIVARELGVPCIVGTGNGTARVPDGAEIEVDGGTGRVTLTRARTG